MCQLHGLVKSRLPKVQLMEFVDALISISTDKAQPLGDYATSRIALATAFICRRLGYARKAATVVAMTVSFLSAVGHERRASCLWYLGCTFTFAWDLGLDPDSVLIDMPTNKPQPKKIIRGWQSLRVAALLRLAHCAEGNGNKVMAIQACAPYVYLYFNGGGSSQLRSVRVNEGYLVGFGIVTPFRRQLWKMSLPLVMDFAGIYTPLFSGIDDDIKASGAANELSTLIFDPFLSKDQIFVEKASSPTFCTVCLVQGERHRIKTKLKSQIHADLPLVAVCAELQGVESVAHEHFFDRDLDGAFSKTIVLDATPLSREYDLEFTRTWITMDGKTNSATSAMTLAFGLTKLKKKSVSAPLPQILARVGQQTTSFWELRRMADYYMTMGYPETDFPIKLWLTSVNGLPISQMEIRVGPLKSLNNDVIFSWKALPSQDNKAKRHACSFLSQGEQLRLTEKLCDGVTSLDVLVHIRRGSALRHLGLQVRYLPVGFDGVYREVTATIILMPRSSPWSHLCGEVM